MDLLEVRELELNRDVFHVTDVHDDFQDRALEDTIQRCSKNCSTLAVEREKVGRQALIDVLGRVFKEEGFIRVLVQ